MTPLMRPEYFAPGLEFAGHFIVALLFAFWLLTRYVDDPDERIRAERLPLADRAASPEQLALMVGMDEHLDPQHSKGDAGAAKLRFSATTVTLTAVALAGFVLPVLTMAIASRAGHTPHGNQVVKAAQRTAAAEAEE